MKRKRITKFKILKSFIISRLFWFCVYLHAAGYCVGAISEINDNLTTATMIIAGGIGIFILLSGIIKYLKLLAGGYCIDVDVVARKEVEHDSEDGDSYFITFAHSGYRTSVSHREYNTIQYGEQYFLVKYLFNKPKYAKAYRCLNYKLAPWLAPKVRIL